MNHHEQKLSEGGYASGGASMSARDQVMDHEYDGIREYDNPTPGWWHAIFLTTAVFALFYWAIYTFSPLKLTPQDAVAKRQKMEFQKIFGSLGELQPDEATILKMMKDDRMMQVAQGMFAGNCAACHAKDGGAGGMNGVNLCDNNYKNVKKIEDVFTVITKGANSGAMPPTEQRYSQNERVLLAAYAAKLRGTTPASPKGAEGEVIPAWPAPK